MGACNGDKAAQHEVRKMCRNDIVFFMDTFGWTFAPKLYPNCPNRPFITWPFQEEALRRMTAAIGKHDLLIEKSRDVGATWMVMAAFLHKAMFFHDQLFLVGSRKEELVDQAGDPGCLFWKIDYMLGKLPPWMRPNITRTRLHLAFHDTGSVIDGESTNENFGRGDRRQAIGLDEFASVENGRQIMSSTRDTTDCRIMFSTPMGAFGAFYEQRQNMLRECPERVLRLHWTVHPEKAAGLYYDIEGKPRSPWYDEQCIRASSPQEIAQELDIDYAASSWKVLDPRIIDNLVREYTRPPIHVGELMHDHGNVMDWLELDGGGNVKLWVNLIDGKLPETGDKYVCGCDISTGKGGEQSSQSVASIWNRATKTKVAEFCVRDLDPADFAEYCVALCRLFKNAYLIHEVNGPGEIFGKRMINDLQYSNVFMRASETRIGRPKTMLPGFYSTPNTKRTLLLDYFKQLRDLKIVNRSDVALKECNEYDHFPNGVIAHCRSLAKDSDPASSGQNHGDIVIADALACRAMQDFAQRTETEATEPEHIPEGSFAFRQKLYARSLQHAGKY